MSKWVTISEAAELFGVSRRYLQYLVTGRPESDERYERPPVLRKVKTMPYGQKSMYLLNVDELNKYFGERK